MDELINDDLINAVVKSHEWALYGLMAFLFLALGVALRYYRPPGDDDE
ncbi:MULTISPECIES: hypothetical protein [Mycobacteriaceae]|jgi:hypothetical protein|nr:MULTISPECIES: hypothetical protein [Mycobacteriaceae]ETZ66965.1 hypothetical protein L841_3215 [Mycobacterium sp. MAC_080597_8934]ETZ75020.1 hypothetical protein L840_1311 [Mycobacterium sp. MAC_011194_8550]SKQ84958.1 Uncharacterised protein [Mycobacteroides abscessus subsp. massiliense]